MPLSTNLFGKKLYQKNDKNAKGALTERTQPSQQTLFFVKKSVCIPKRNKREGERLKPEFKYKGTSDALINPVQPQMIRMLKVSLMKVSDEALFFMQLLQSLQFVILLVQALIGKALEYMVDGASSLRGLFLIMHIAVESEYLPIVNPPPVEILALLCNH